MVLVKLMLKKKKYKPLYKKFVHLRQNVQNRKKIYNFKKQKWQKVLKHLYKLKKKNIRMYDQNIYYKPKFTFYFNNKFKNDLHVKQRFNFFYGGLTVNHVKSKVKKMFNNFNNKTNKYNFINMNSYFVEIFESRIDVILYRSHFAYSIRNARQLISHGRIFINSTKIKDNSYHVKKNDLIEIDFKSHTFIKNNLINSNNWPIPPKYLHINYKTFQIILLFNVKYINVIFHHPFWLNINSLINYYNR